jgi:hypothetical protein
MKKVYVARCIVKRDGKTYKKGKIIDDLTEDEIKKGLAEKWLGEVGGDMPAETESGNPKGKEEPSNAKKEALAKKAAKLGIDITDEMTADEIQQLITEKEAGVQ